MYTKILLLLLVIVNIAPFQLYSKENFKIETLTEQIKSELKRQKMWNPECPVDLDRLSLITVSHYDFDGQIRNDGQIIVMDAVADSVVTIFKELFNKKFPIAYILPLESSAEEENKNVTSAFYCRKITAGHALSIHSYGLAIDVNIVQNPYINAQDPDNILLIPSGGKDYINRIKKHPGMVEDIIGLFKENGFTVWGGLWTSPIDWQHFQTPKTIAEILSFLPSDKAKEFFSQYYIKYHEIIDKKINKDFEVIQKIKIYYKDHKIKDLDYILELLEVKKIA